MQIAFFNPSGGAAAPVFGGGSAQPKGKAADGTSGLFEALFSRIEGASPEAKGEPQHDLLSAFLTERGLSLSDLPAAARGEMEDFSPRDLEGLLQQVTGVSAPRAERIVAALADESIPPEELMSPIQNPGEDLPFGAPTGEQGLSGTAERQEGKFPLRSEGEVPAADPRPVSMNGGALPPETAGLAEARLVRLVEGEAPPSRSSEGDRGRPFLQAGMPAASPSGEEPPGRAMQQDIPAPAEGVLRTGEHPVQDSAPVSALPEVRAASEKPAALPGAHRAAEPVFVPQAAPATMGVSPALAGQPQATAIPAGGESLYLPSGQVVPEQRVVEQVVGRLSVDRVKESSSLTLRLHPQELGEVTLELALEKDHVRAHLVAQNQQVQEVLERHLPRLRQALETAGLKLDELQVGVDSQRQDEHSFFREQHRQARPSFWRVPAVRAGVEGVSPVPMSPLGGGINLRV